MTWQEYEEQVLAYFKVKYPNGRVQKNVQLFGYRSKTERQIDVLLESTTYGCSMQIVVECKNWSTKLDVSDIDSFIGKLQDIGISKGIIISRLGYTDAARQRARSEINVQLQVLDFENVPEFRGFWGNPYRGPYGAIVSAPNGWIINPDNLEDSKHTYLCVIHPFEFTVEDAISNNAVMYFQIYPVIDGLNLKNTFLQQDEDIKEIYPEAKITHWNEEAPSGNILYRQCDFNNGAGSEITGGIDCGKFYAYCVCILPVNYVPDDIARLKYLMGDLRLIEIEGVNPADSHADWHKLIPWKSRLNP